MNTLDDTMSFLLGQIRFFQDSIWNTQEAVRFEKNLRDLCNVVFWFPYPKRKRMTLICCFMWQDIACLGGKRKEVTSGRFESLKVVEIVGWVGNAADTELAVYLLEKAVSLDKMIIDPGHPSLLIRSVFEESSKKGEDAARERAKQLERKLPAGTKLVIY